MGVRALQELELWTGVLRDYVAVRRAARSSRSSEHSGARDASRYGAIYGTTSLEAWPEMKTTVYLDAHPIVTLDLRDFGPVELKGAPALRPRDR